MSKTDFKNLLSQVSVQKEKEIPVQRVVPTLQKSSAKKKIAASLFLSDWLALTQFKAFRIVQEQNMEYTIGSAISDGLGLLQDKYKFKTGTQKVALRRGRRDLEAGEDVKTTSFDLTQEDFGLLNDFLFYQVFTLEKVDYTRPEMFSEIVNILKKKYPAAFNS